MTHSSLPSRKRSTSRALALRNDFSPFGNKLIELGYADRTQMEQALVQTRTTRRPSHSKS